MGVKRAIDEHLATGPRIYPSVAAITQTGGHGDFRNLDNPTPQKGGYPDETETMSLAYIADGKAEVMRGARDAFRKGASQVKMLVSGSVSGLHDPVDVQEYTNEEISAVVEVAENFGTYVMVHAYNDRSIQASLLAGVKSIEHGNLISEETMKLMADKGAFLSAQTFAYTQKLPYFDDEQIEQLNKTYAGLDQMFTLAKKYNVTVTHSTDIYGTPANFANAPQEFILRQKWFTPVEIMEQATTNAAQLLALSGARNPYPDHALGVIEEGAYADVILVDGDPTQNVFLLAKPDDNLSVIIKNGEIYKNVPSD